MRALLLAALLVVASLAGCATPATDTPPANNTNSTAPMDNMTMSVATIELGESPTAPAGPAVGPGSMYMHVKGFEAATVGKMITINITNKGTQTHNVVIEGTDFKSGDVAAGKSLTKTWTPTKDGTFTAYCDIGPPVSDPSGQNVGSHRGNGMSATITVKKAS